MANFSERGGELEGGPEIQQVVDWVSFPRAIGEMVRHEPDFAGATYSAAFPKEPAELPRIVYRLMRRTPGIEHVETRKPRLRQSLIQADQSRLEVYSQWQTCLYQFDICALSGVEADDLALRFDRFLRGAVGFLIGMGAKDFQFEEQLEDGLLPKAIDYVARSLRWTAYLENYETQLRPGIQEIRVRDFFPRVETVETLVRGRDLSVPDTLETKYLSQIVAVSDPAPDGIGRNPDYLEGLDFLRSYDPPSGRTQLVWLPPGRHPAPGAAYSVRFNYWTGFSTLRLP